MCDLGRVVEGGLPTLLIQLKREHKIKDKLPSYIHRTTYEAYKRRGRQYTVRLRTHVLHKPTHFFFHSFIATISYSLQTSFNSLIKTLPIYTMYRVPPQGHLQGQTRDNSNTRFFHIEKEHIHVFLYNICLIYICPIISCLKGFVLFYHMLHIYGMNMSLKIYLR